MHDPWWYMPGLTAPLLIAIIAVLHIFVALYAVGGGCLLAIETRYARRHDDRAYLACLQSHVGFFVLLTVVYGAITGVSIWWTIGLTSPLPTASLRHTASRQWLQAAEIGRVFDPSTVHVRTQWSPLIAFLVLLVAGLGVVVWMLRQVRGVAATSITAAGGA